MSSSLYFSGIATVNYCNFKIAAKPASNHFNLFFFFFDKTDFNPSGSPYSVIYENKKLNIVAVNY